MVIWHKTLADRFSSFDPKQQIIMVCNELNRAQNQGHNPTEYKNSLERALELMDFLITDKRWQPKLKEILRARDIVSQYYLAQPQSTTSLQKALIQLNPAAWKLIHKSLE